jgi:flavin-dependent dehydrogenase
VLASRGRRVLLLEKDRLPRRKVCGELLSGRARASLERLGVLAEVEAIAAPIRGGVFHLASGRAIPFVLPSPALGISRYSLDAILAQRAATLGAEVRCGARVLGIERRGAGFAVRWAGAGGSAPGDAEASAAVGAWGRWDALDRALERRFGKERARYLGWSCDYRCPGSGDVSLYVFPGGYCGLSPIEEGRVHLAGVVSERLRRTLEPGWPAVVAHARRANAALDRDLRRLDGREDGEAFGTGPVYFTRKPPSSGGAVLAGDAAGVLDPFSGEGQASALASGILAGDTVERGLSAARSPDAVAVDYAKAWRRLFGGRFAWSAAFRTLVLSPRLASLAAGLAGDRLLTLAVRKLSEP